MLCIELENSPLACLRGPLSLRPSWGVTLQDENNVRKSSHCAWQIHYHIVFPVKDRKVLLDEEVTKIIRETAVSIKERYPIEMEALGTDKNHIHVLV